jgi:excisionase family DNA binding protein
MGGQMKLITATVASEFLNIRIQRLYELVRQRAIPYVKIGSRQLRFDMDELIAWAKRGGADGTVPDQPKLED